MPKVLHCNLLVFEICAPEINVKRWFTETIEYAQN